MWWLDTNAAPGAAFCFWARSAGWLLLLLLALPAAAQTATTADPERAAHAIVAKTNALRERAGAPRVVIEKHLTQAAREFAKFLSRSDKYGHTADGRQPHERAQAHGYAYCIVLENIAYQFRSRGFAADELAQTLVAGWERSPGHRKNMLSPDVTQIGVGVARNERTGYYYAVQLFGRPKADMTSFSVANETSTHLSYRLGDRSYELAPRVTRTHKQCGADPLEFLLPGQTKPMPIAPAHGAHYVIGSDGRGGVELRKR
jgi:uncharacterized protein YkwD